MTNFIYTFALCYRFVEEFFKEPYRGYGRNVITVFEALKEEKFRDPYGPAARQFDGAGSRGNGGAMRISPAALFAVKQQPEKVDVILTFVSHKCVVINVIISLFIQKSETYKYTFRFSKLIQDIHECICDSSEQNNSRMA